MFPDGWVDCEESLDYMEFLLSHSTTMELRESIQVTDACSRTPSQNQSQESLPLLMAVFIYDWLSTGTAATCQSVS
jgi:hypothetical protein